MKRSRDDDADPESGCQIEKGEDGERADGERADGERTVYLATGGTYRSICAQPLTTQTAYVGT